jgi:hypothetical protein
MEPAWNQLSLELARHNISVGKVGSSARAGPDPSIAAAAGSRVALSQALQRQPSIPPGQLPKH